ncbi:Derlin [Meloidogyne graminicola]|uniref:Derlin n=2 Tax=Meloidogyne TaxID=189290 RepID=A0A8T0A2X1_9BILA|nr:Derlin [Meloidogyne graminicola]
MGDFGEWYRSIPIITRYWFTGATVIPLMGRFGLFSPYLMLLDFELFFYKFQLWRPLTALFYYPVTPQTGFHWLLMCYFLYNYSKDTETSVYDGRPADYLFMLIFNWICCTIICFVSEIFFLLEPMVLSVLYVWCQFNKDRTVSFWFGMQFKAIYLPWVLVAFNMVLRGGGINELIGILVGHTYYFLAFQYALDYGGSVIIKTPQFLYNYLPNRVGGFSGFGSVPQSRSSANRGGAAGGGHNWGRGRELGGDQR